MKKTRKIVWVCQACGKRSNDIHGEKPIDLGWDVSCTLNAIWYDEDSLEFNEQGRVNKVEAVEDGEKGKEK